MAYEAGEIFLGARVQKIVSTAKIARGAVVTVGVVDLGGF